MTTPIHEKSSQRCSSTSKGEGKESIPIGSRLSFSRVMLIHEVRIRGSQHLTDLVADVATPVTAPDMPPIVVIAVAATDPPNGMRLRPRPRRRVAGRQVPPRAPGPDHVQDAFWP